MKKFILPIKQQDSSLLWFEISEHFVLLVMLKLKSCLVFQYIPSSLIKAVSLVFVLSLEELSGI